MKAFLVDGTYELFRHFYAKVPRHMAQSGQDVTAVRGVLSSVIGMIDAGALCIGVATDHVIESFRNDMWLTYKNGDGVDPILMAQFGPLEDALRALGVTVWAMVDEEADDALAAAARVGAADASVEQVVICTPDKDLAQCVVGDRVVQLDRRKDVTIDADGVFAKFGVLPESIPDWLALVGDSADGFPGLPGWGAKTAAAVLARYRHLESIPLDGDWDVQVRGAPKLAATLSDAYAAAELFRTLARLRDDLEVGVPAEWVWQGPTKAFWAMCEELKTPDLAGRAARAAEKHGLREVKR